MNARLLRKGRQGVLSLCLLALVPTHALAAPSKPARKAAVRGKASARKGDFRTTFAAAVRLFEDFEYERALKQFTKAQALAQGAEQEVPVALYRGIVLAELGKREESLASFRTGLYLQPDAKLPVRVSPKLERDFEEVRQSVLRDLGIRGPGPVAESSPQEVAPAPAGPEPVPAPPAGDRPVQPPPVAKDPDLAARVEPPPPPPAYVPSSAQRKASSGRVVLPLALMGAGVVAGGAAGYFGLLSVNNVQSARDATFYTQRVERLKTAGDQAFVANVLFGTAGAAAVGALVAFLIPGGSAAPASPSTGGTP